ncbi:unnamed protein product [Candida parapsilosis]
MFDFPREREEYYVRRGNPIVYFSRTTFKNIEGVGGSDYS